MQNSFINHSEMVWSLAILVAWLIGELGYQLTKIPRISFYVLVGFLFSNNQSGVLPDLSGSEVSFLINIAIGLVLFEFGYRINLNWLRNNPIIVLTGVVESIATFIVVFILSRIFGVNTLVALEFASLAIATSPIVVMYLINHHQCSGQVTERTLHLTAINSILAIFSFKMFFALQVFQISGSLWKAVWSSALMLILSVALGGLFALLLAVIIRRIRAVAIDRTIVFSLLVIFITAVAGAAGLSPIVAALAFGLISRYRRVAAGRTQRNFGALGELLVVMLFVATPTSLSWHGIWVGFGMSLALILARAITKIGIVGLFSHFSGISWTKGFLTGLALNPIAVFSILLLDQTKYLGIALNDQLSSMATLILLMEFIGPIITMFAFVKAKEALTT